MRLLEQQLLKTSAWVAGDSFTLADIGIGLATHRWFETPLERPILPALADYYRRLQLRPGFNQYAVSGGP